MKNQSLAIFFFLCTLNAILAQKSELIDSLKSKLLKVNADTTTMMLHYKLGRELDGFEPDTAEYHYNEALKIAEKLNVKKRMARCFSGLGGVKIDKGLFENSISFYEKSLKLNIEINDTLGWCADYDNMGIALLHIGKIEKAIEFRNKSLDIYLQRNDKSLILNAYMWIANCEGYRGCHTLSLKNYFSALKLAEEIKDTISINHALGNIAGVYRTQKRYNEALDIYNQCLVAFKAANSKQDESLVYYLMGNIYSDLSNREKAIENYLLALKINNELNSSTVAFCYNGLGMQYEELGENEKARKYLELSHGIAKKLNMRKSEGISLLALGVICSKESNFAQSNSLLSKALEIFKELNDDVNIASCFKKLSDNYEKMGNFKKAIMYYKLYAEVSDSVENEVHSRAILDVEATYESEKKDARINQITVESNLKEAKIEQQRIIGFSVVSSILLFGSMLFYFWKKRKNYLFEQKISEVKQEAINAQMSDHFISNTMNSINNFIEKNDKEKASEYLLLFNRVIRRVLENSFQKFVPLKNDLDVLKDYFDLEKLRFKENSLGLEVKIDNEIDSSNTMIPPMIFQTLVENSIIHGFKNVERGTIKISIKKNENDVECAVEDNGIGRNASMSSRQEENKTNLSYGTGLAERLVTISGGLKGNSSYNVIDLFDEEQNPIGTRTEIRFPIVSH